MLTRPRLIAPDQIARGMYLLPASTSIGFGPHARRASSLGCFQRIRAFSGQQRRLPHCPIAVQHHSRPPGSRELELEPLPTLAKPLLDLVEPVELSCLHRFLPRLGSSGFAPLCEARALARKPSRVMPRVRVALRDRAILVVDQMLETVLARPFAPGLHRLRLRAMRRQGSAGTSRSFRQPDSAGTVWMDLLSAGKAATSSVLALCLSSDRARLVVSGRLPLQRRAPGPRVPVGNRLREPRLHPIDDSHPSTPFVSTLPVSLRVGSHPSFRHIGQADGGELTQIPYPHDAQT